MTRWGRPIFLAQNTGNSGVETCPGRSGYVSPAGYVMAAVKSKHTTPEMVVRRLVHGLGYRYRLHVEELPGRMPAPPNRAAAFLEKRTALTKMTAPPKAESHHERISRREGF